MDWFYHANSGDYLCGKTIDKRRCCFRIPALLFPSIGGQDRCQCWPSSPPQWSFIFHQLEWHDSSRHARCSSIDSKHHSPWKIIPSWISLNDQLFQFDLETFRQFIFNGIWLNWWIIKILCTLFKFFFSIKRIFRGKTQWDHNRSEEINAAGRFTYTSEYQRY